MNQAEARDLVRAALQQVARPASPAGDSLFYRPPTQETGGQGFGKVPLAYSRRAFQEQRVGQPPLTSPVLDTLPEWSLPGQGFPDHHPTPSRSRNPSRMVALTSSIERDASTTR